MLAPGFEPGRDCSQRILNPSRLPVPACELGSPCLLVKGADCAGDVLPVWGVVICRSLEAGPCRSALCRVASVGTVCPTYLPRALFSCGPRANRAGGAGCIVAAPARSTYRIVWWQFVREDIPSLPIRESVTSRLLRSSVQAKHTCPSRRTRLPRILCGRRRGWSRTGCRVRPPSGPGSGLLGFPRRT